MSAPLEGSKGEPASQPERRQGARQRLTMLVAKLRCHGGEYPCIVQDVSESGAKLRLFHGHPPDTHMYLELSNGELYAVERRWIEGDFAGFLFSSAIDIEEFLHEPSAKPKRPIRLRIAHPVKFAAAGEQSHAYMVDLSAQGACIEAGRRLARRSLLHLEIPGMSSRIAHVCWRQKFRHGLVFQEALSLKELARLAAELQPFDAEPASADFEGLSARAICA